MVGYGLFINPKAIKRLIAVVFRLPFLKRWQQEALDAGDEIAMASKELTAKPFSFWLKSFIATFFSWTSRYWVANFLILALFFGLRGQLNHDIISFSEQIHIFARQLVMWIMMMVMPTPGGTGFSEVVFLQYMNVFIPQGFSSLMAIIWRFVSYYPYLFIGAVILPGWIRRSFKRRHAPREMDTQEEQV